ncbi:hypothetical protein IBX73_04665 [candidate division WOR-3 bacterium]|nr:hypothetical protein [candidate division WOR-3 bacterium]
MAKTHIVILLPLVALICSSSCSRACGLRAIRSGDFSIVQRGSYRGWLTMVTEGMEQVEAAERLRAMVDKNIEVLNMISDRFHVIEHVGYRFKYAALDVESNELVLRYFTRIVEHPLYAGYQIQLVFDGGSRRLKGVYTAEVPLE